MKRIENQRVGDGFNAGNGTASNLEILTMSEEGPPHFTRISLHPTQFLCFNLHLITI